MHSDCLKHGNDDDGFVNQDYYVCFMLVTLWTRMRTLCVREKVAVLSTYSIHNYKE